MKPKEEGDFRAKQFISKKTVMTRDVNRCGSILKGLCEKQVTQSVAQSVRDPVRRDEEVADAFVAGKASFKHSAWTNLDVCKSP